MHLIYKLNLDLTFPQPLLPLPPIQIHYFIISSNRLMLRNLNEKMDQTLNKQEHFRVVLIQDITEL